MSKWEECPLGDMIRLKRGYDLPHRERVDGKFPIISSSGVSGFHKEAKVKGPGVVTGRYGTLGEIFYIPEDFWPLNTSLYVQNFKGNDPRFISYFLQTLGLGSQNIAGAVPGVNRNALHKLMVRKPPLPVQRKIAAVLSAYDDLIENNTRRIALLEKMAEEIYREWFVRLRFPRHEQVTFHKGIPAGWDFENLENLGFLGRGKSKHRPRNDPSLYGGDHPFIQTGDVKEASPFLYITSHIQTYNKKGLAQSKLWNPGTLLITIAANIAETAILTYPACMPDSIIGFVAKSQRVSPEYIKYSIDCLKLQMQNISQGTTQDNFSQAKLGTFKFLIPRQEIMEQFVQATESIFQQIRNLLFKNQNLQQTRDRLLTRLISGKLSVADLDIHFPPSMTAEDPHEQ